MMKLSKTRGLVFLFLMAVFATSCGGVMKASTLPPPVSASMARVFFIFPGHRVMGVGAGAAYVTEEVKLVGLISNRQAFHVDVPPGKHLFMAMMSNTDSVEVDAAAGKNYYVMVSSAPNPIPYASPLITLTPVVPNFSQWEMRHKWLAAVKFTEYKPEKGAKWEAKYLEKNEERVANIRSGEATPKPIAADQGD